MRAKKAAKPGRVFLVGAGPGDPGLLTLKGRSAIERADAVIYDFLANPALLRFAPVNSEKLCAGKRAGHPTLSQEQVNRLLIQRARTGKTVVRLKGGDPFVFGRGGEEALALAQAHIPFEIIPGVTSGYAAPAYAGIPVTHRGLGSTVTFVTAHSGVSNHTEPQWKKLAEASDTLVLFMGTRKIGEIARSLIRNGRKADTPAAVIQWGTRTRQRVAEGTLSNIAQHAKNIQPPALIVIGKVARLRRSLRWFEGMPLFGRRIVVTRAREQAAQLAQSLEELGAEVCELPSIEIQNPPSWKELDAAIHNLDKFNFLLFTSANGVKKFLQRLEAAGKDARSLRGLMIGAIGPGTDKALAAASIKADLLPRKYLAEGLLEALSMNDVRGKAFLIPRARIARDVLPATLRRRGARVSVVEAYRTKLPKLELAERRNLADLAPDGVTFTSSSTVTNFLKLFGSRPPHWFARAAKFSIGPITSATIRNAGYTVAAEARDSTITGLTEAIRRYYAGRRGKS